MRYRHRMKMVVGKMPILRRSIIRIVVVKEPILLRIHPGLMQKKWRKRAGLPVLNRAHIKHLIVKPPA